MRTLLDSRWVAPKPHRNPNKGLGLQLRPSFTDTLKKSKSHGHVQCVSDVNYFERPGSPEVLLEMSLDHRGSD